MILLVYMDENIGLLFRGRCKVFKLRYMKASA